MNWVMSVFATQKHYIRFILRNNYFVFYSKIKRFVSKKV